MTAHHRYRSIIPPVEGDGPKPLWSVMVPTFNCGPYLREALAGILAQDPGPNLMQIEVIDDYSTTDDPETLVNECGRGRISFYRQSQNVGHIGNLTTCLLRARGKIVHLLHGDDGIKPGFYEKLQMGFEKGPQIGAAFCRQIFIDEHGRYRGISPLEQSESGVLHNWLEHLALEQRIMTPSIVVRRAAYESLGGFDSRLVCAEDWEMWMRIAAHYPIWYEPEPLALYRMHTDSNTGRHVRSGEDISYTCRAIEIFKKYLPVEIAAHVSRKARETYARSALQMAERLCRNGDVEAARAQVRAAVFCSHSPRVLRWAALLSVQLCARSWR
jgi:glycosyltransferase involved in cell wall biosynthesis